MNQLECFTIQNRSRPHSQEGGSHWLSAGFCSVIGQIYFLHCVLLCCALFSLTDVVTAILYYYLGTNGTVTKAIYFWLRWMIDNLVCIEPIPCWWNRGIGGLGSIRWTGVKCPIQIFILMEMVGMCICQLWISDVIWCREAAQLKAVKF